MQKPPLIAKVDLKTGCECAASKQVLKLMDGGYVSTNLKIPPRIVAAGMNCQQTYPGLLLKIKKRAKGNFLREAKKSASITAISDFRPSEYAEDIESINKSKPVRSGRPMRPAYNRSADALQADYAGEPRRDCRVHWSMWYGVFAVEVPDVHKRLVGYICLKRYGELAIYSTILGHGSWLSFGIMPALHLAIAEDLMLNENYFEGIKWLMYAGWNDGGKGLNLWKRKAGFDPVMFFIK